MTAGKIFRKEKYDVSYPTIDKMRESREEKKMKPSKLNLIQKSLGRILFLFKKSLWVKVTLQESVLLEIYRGKESKYCGERVQRIHKRTESLVPEEIVLHNHRN